MFLQVLGSDQIAIGQQDRSLDRVLELSHIALPGALKKIFQGLGAETQTFTSIFLGVFFQEIDCQEDDILPSFPERRQSDSDHIKTIEEILPKSPLSNLGL
jgi:hypothetical protein